MYNFQYAQFINEKVTMFSNRHYSYSEDINYLEEVKEKIEKNIKIYNENRAEMMEQTSYPATVDASVFNSSKESRYSTSEAERIAYGLEMLGGMCRQAIMNLQFYKELKNFYKKFNGNNALIYVFLKHESEKFQELSKIIKEFEQARKDNKKDEYLEQLEDWNLRMELRSDNPNDVFRFGWGDHAYKYLQSYYTVIDTINKKLYRSTEGKEVVWSKQYATMPNNEYIFYGSTEDKNIELTISFGETEILRNYYGSKITPKVKSKRKNK